MVHYKNPLLVIGAPNSSNSKRLVEVEVDVAGHLEEVRVGLARLTAEELQDPQRRPVAPAPWWTTMSKSQPWMLFLPISLAS